MTTQTLVSQIADVMIGHRLETASTRCICGVTLYGKASPAGFAEHMAEDVRRRVFNKANLATLVLAAESERDALAAKVARVGVVADRWEQWCVDRCSQRDRKPWPGHDCGIARIDASADLRTALTEAER